jgi:hypothetical protein
MRGGGGATSAVSLAAEATVGIATALAARNKLASMALRIVLISRLLLACGAFRIRVAALDYTDLCSKTVNMLAVKTKIHRSVQS